MHNMRRRVMGSLMAVLMSTSTILGSCPAPIFAVPTTTEKEVVADSTDVNANEYGLVSATKGNILHAWDWKFTDVTANIKDIAEAGYSNVQVSPCQTIREDVKNNSSWWQFYQPTDFVFGNSLGTEADFVKMCKTAEQYGVNIIVDVVTNHLAGSDTALDAKVASKWSADTKSYFHNYGQTYKADDDKDRVKMVTGTIGMPDLNTENATVQDAITSYLGKLLDMGADGLRFDAAKHIGTPSDSGAAQSNYWKVVADYVKAKNPNALLYGEILNDIPVDINYYTPYIKVTESQKGWDMKDLLVDKQTVSKKLAFDYTRTTGAKNLITWVESHDTYCNALQETGTPDTANYMENKAIELAWSVVAARADAQSLFFARPAGITGSGSGSSRKVEVQGAIGINTGDNTWKSTAVASVNKFKNAMVNESESCSINGNAAIIKRGNKGVVVTNFGDATTVPVDGLTGLKDGTYKDASGQNGTITVSGGKASISVKGQSFVVLYDESAATITPTEAPTETPDNGEVAVSASKANSKFKESFDVTVTAKNAQEAYYSYDGAEWVEFDKTATVTIGKEELKNGDEVGLYLYAFDKDGKAVEKSYTYTKEVEGTVGTGFSVRVKKSDFATAPNIYVYDDEHTGDASYTGKWPGVAMEADGDYWVYSDAKITSASVIINQNGVQWPSGEKTPGFVVSCPSEFSKSTANMSAITTAPVQGDKKAGKPATNPTFKGVATEAPTETPVVTEVPTETPTPTATPVVVEELDVKASVANGTSFDTETMDVELTLQNATSGTYSVDGGPEKTFTDKVTVTVGEGKIADRDVTLKVTAKNATGTTEETFTYKKEFNKAKAAKEQAVVKTSAVKRLNTLFEVVAEAAQVNVASNDTLAAQYGTNTVGIGKKKTITIDKSIDDWSSDMLIAQGAANDDPRVYRTNSMYESPVDSYALYGAYDDNNLYLMWEMTNVQDVVAPNDNYPLSQGVLFQTENFPFFIAVDTGKDDKIGNKGALQTAGTIWNSGITIENSFNRLIAISTNGSNGPYVYSGDSTGLDPVEIYSKAGGGESGAQKSDIQFGYGLGILSSTVKGIDKAYGSNNNRIVGDVCDDSAAWTEFNAQGHNSATMDFHYEIAIPYSELGITASDVENNGVGALIVSTMGKSGMDCLPYDVSMNDQADLDDSAGSQENNSFEKSDEDNITCSFARIGKGDINPGKTPMPATPTPSAEVSVSPSAEVSTSPSADVTATPSTDVTTTPAVTTGTSVTSTPEVTSGATVTTAPVVSEAPVTSMIVNFGAEKSAPQLAGNTLKLEAEGFNGAGKVTYEFAIDGTVVQAASEASTYNWYTTNGKHTIQVTMADEAGNKVVSKKTYTIEGENVPTETPVVTVSPSAIPPVDDTPTEAPTAVPTATPTAIPATPTTVPTTEPTATPVPVTIKVSAKLGKAAPQKVGTSIKITASASGGTAPYKFTYVASLKNGFTKTIAKSTTKKTVTWKPTKAGTYTIKITAKDANGKTGTKKFTYKVTSKKLAITKLKVSAKKIKVKKKLKITVAGTASKGTLKFKYSYKLGKKTKVLKKYSTKKTYTWKPNKAGKYTIIVQAKDGSGKVVKKTVKVTVKKK